MSEYEWSYEMPTDVFFDLVKGVLILMAIAAAAAILVRLVRTWQPKLKQRAVDNLSRQMNLVVPEHVRESLSRAITARKRGAEIGSFIGFSIFVLYLRPWSDSPPDISLVALIPIIAGGTASVSLGTVIGGLFARRAAPSEHRAARLTPLKFSDLLAPTDYKLLAGALIPGLALPAVLTLLIVAPWANRNAISIAEVLLILLTGLIAAGLGLALPRIGRWLVSTRAIAGDEHALAWSDALAARTLRDIAHLAASIGGLAGMMAYMGIGFSLPASWEWFTTAWFSVIGFLFLGAIVTFAIVTTLGEPERHVQRTLWPQFAADAK